MGICIGNISKLGDACAYSWCCCICHEHFKCFTSVWHGCSDADKAMQKIFTRECGVGFMWVNDNQKDACPINGFMGPNSLLEPSTMEGVDSEQVHAKTMDCHGQEKDATNYQYCQGCPGKGRKQSEEPCCRCDHEIERKARLLNDEALITVHETIMGLANAWRMEKAPSLRRWDSGRVCGAALVFHRLARIYGHEAADTALWEYHALVGLAMKHVLCGCADCQDDMGR